MTSNFDNFVNLFLEATSFLDLPDRPPYGFWISPTGEFFPVRFERHYEEALKIMSRNRKLRQEYEDDRHPDMYNFLSSRKYLRVVMEGDTYYADIFSYDLVNSVIVPFIPTNTSVKLLKDIAEFYGKKVIFNKM